MNNNNDQVTRAELLAQIEALKAQQAQLLKKERSTFNLKVSEKGAVSVYGMGRFPVTLYAGQWETLISHIPEIQAFIAANESKLNRK